MKNAAILRNDIETTLRQRVPHALSPRARVEPERLACGVAALDDLLRGGVPEGAVTEVVGPESSGRTTAALSLVAQMTRTERVAAWIDVADVLDPEAAAASGVDLERLLWVRCGAKDVSSPSVRAGGIWLATAEPAKHAVKGGGSPHPRSEGRGMPEAIGAILAAHGGIHDSHLRRERSIGTPGAPNRPLVVRARDCAVDREEQVASDRLPARRGKYIAQPRCAEPMQERCRSVSPAAGPLEWNADLKPKPARSKRPWDALDKALRTTDLLLQGGGFSVIVLDLGSTPAEMAWRIPLATWFRYRAACERTRVSLLLLTQHPCARSSAEVVVRMGAGRFKAENKVMTGIAYSAVRERQRFELNDNIVSIRKPPRAEGSSQGARWKGDAAWAIGR